MNSSLLATVLVSATLLSGCGKSENDSSGASAAKPTEATPTAPSAATATEYKEIAWMNLKAKVAADAEISDTSADAPNAMISSGDCTIMVATVTEAYGSFDSTVRDAEKGVGNKVKTWIKKEKTADGFHLEFEGTSLMGEPIREITVRRKVGDQEIECGRAGEEAEVACVAEVCASLQAI